MKKKNKINIIFRYITLSLLSFLIIRYIPEGRIKIEDSLGMCALISCIVIMLDMYYPIIN